MFCYFSLHFISTQKYPDSESVHDIKFAYVKNKYDKLCTVVLSLFRGKNFDAKRIRCFVLVAGNFRFPHWNVMNDSFRRGGSERSQSAADNEG